jgi:hypothetical protein
VPGERRPSSASSSRGRPEIRSGDLNCPSIGQGLELGTRRADRDLAAGADEVDEGLELIEPGAPRLGRCRSFFAVQCGAVRGVGKASDGALCLAPLLIRQPDRPRLLAPGHVSLKQPIECVLAEGPGAADLTAGPTSLAHVVVQSRRRSFRLCADVASVARPLRRASIAASSASNSAIAWSMCPAPACAAARPPPAAVKMPA